MFSRLKIISTNYLLKVNNFSIIIFRGEHQRPRNNGAQCKKTDCFYAYCSFAYTYEMVA